MIESIKDDIVVDKSLCLRFRRWDWEVSLLEKYLEKSLYIFSFMFFDFTSQVRGSIFSYQYPNVSNFILGSRIALNAMAMLYSSQYLSNFTIILSAIYLITFSSSSKLSMKKVWMFQTCKKYKFDVG